MNLLKKYKESDSAVNVFFYLALIFSLFVTLSVFTYTDTEYIEDAAVLEDFDFSSRVAILSPHAFELHPDVLYTPEDFARGIASQPASWLSGRMDMATVRLTLNLREGVVYGISGPSTGTAMIVWADGIIIGAVGTVGDTLEGMSPYEEHFNAYFMASNASTEIVIQGSNFVHSSGVVFHPLYFGEHTLISDMNILNHVRVGITMGVTLMAVLLFFGVFLFFKGNTRFLWFSLLCLVTALRSFVMDYTLIVTLFPDLSWIFVNRLAFLTPIWAFAALMLFMDSMFHGGLNKILKRVSLAYTAFYTAFFIFTPSMVYTRVQILVTIPIILFIVAVIVNLCYVTIKHKERRHIEYILVLIGGFVNIGSASSEFLSWRSVQSGSINFMQAGITVFIFINIIAFGIYLNRIESNLARIRQRTVDMMNNLPGMAFQMLIEPPDITLTFASKGSEALTGYSADELMNRSVAKYFEMVHPDDVHMLQKVLETTLKEEGFAETNYRITTKDGMEKWLWDRVYVVERDYNGMPRLVEGFSINVTEQHLLEVAKSANNAKSDFLSKMSHEIRTPMNAILGMAELILREEIPKQAREQAVTIKQSGNHLLSIINDILDFSKIESGKLEVFNTQYLFHSIVNDVVSIIKMRLSNPSVRFIAYMEHNTPNELFGDEVRIRQVMLNVLSNAAKYTKEGHFSLEITSEKTDNGIVTLIISVKDTGLGIKPEDLKKLFSEFSQFDLAKNRNIEGTGLGLAITHNLIKLMGGTIEVTSEYGVGSEFIIKLPQKCDKPEYNINRKNLDDISILLYCRTLLITENISRSFDDLQVKYSVVSSESELEIRFSEQYWDYVFAEADMMYIAQNIVKKQGFSSELVIPLGFF